MRHIQRLSCLAAVAWLATLVLWHSRTGSFNAQPVPARLVSRAAAAVHAGPRPPQPLPPLPRPPPPPALGPSYVLASFKNGDALGDGLRVLHSRDGRRWHALPGEPILLPLSSAGGHVFRDPSMVWNGGRFHLVWTTDLCVAQVPGKWKCERRGPERRPSPRFGYATSRDLVTWSDARHVSVPLKGACSLWAPEITALPPDEGGGLMLSFSATVVRHAPCPVNFRATPHRAFVTISRDGFRTLTQPRQIEIDGLHGDSIIDLYPLLRARATARDAAPHVLFFKSESNACAERRWRLGRQPDASAGECTLVIRQASGRNASGPWKVDKCAHGDFFPSAISRPCAEGPAPVRLPGGETLLLYDGYRTDCPLDAPPPCGKIGRRAASDVRLVVSDSDDGSCTYLPEKSGFGAVLSRGDLCEWKDVSSSIHVPDGYKHGTAVALPPDAVRAVCSGPTRSRRRRAQPRGPFASTSVCLGRV